MTDTYHHPVLLKEAVAGLNIKPSGIYVDVTFGGGGHSRDILDLLEDGRLIAFDQDPDAAANVINDARFTLVPHNFRYLRKFLKLHKALPVDGILADLGVSSHQFDVAERGFSTRFEGELDMRMSQSGELSAWKVINEYNQNELQNIFSLYGEIINSKTLAQAIVAARKSATIKTTSDLKRVIASLVRGKEYQYQAQVFQAIRIEVNKEMESLKEMLEQSAEVLKTGGRLVVISYHSLEDRLVKNYMKRGSFEGELVKDFYGKQLKPFKTINSKPITPGEKEIKRNPRSRSAKMRIAEKIEN